MPSQPVNNENGDFASADGEQLPDSPELRAADLPMPDSLIDDLQTTQEFMKLLQEASWTDVSPELRELLQNPPTEELDISNPDLRLSIDEYLACSGASEQTYHSVRAGILRRYPTSSMLSYDQVRRRVKNMTGVTPIVHDMCINSCMAYTGPFAELRRCRYCKERRYKPTESQKGRDKQRELENNCSFIPRQTFTTIPLGPQLQALWRHPETAEKMQHRHRETRAIIDASDDAGLIEIFDSIYCGEDYLEEVKNGTISQFDSLLIYSGDTCKLYKNKDSSAYVAIWTFADMDGDIRYKKRHVSPAFTVGGPNSPQHIISFMLPSLLHLAVLQRFGLKIWDSVTKQIYENRPYLLCATSDTVETIQMVGWVGHLGRYPCRSQCDTPGRHKPKSGSYYPALLRPDSNTLPVHSRHDDVDINSITLGTVKNYNDRLRYLLLSNGPTQRTQRTTETGLTRPSILSGLPRILPIPKSIPPDTMHLFALNIPDLLVPLWRGTFRHYPKSDDPDDWPFAVLKDDAWIEHGRAVADARIYIPTSIESHAPRDPAQKINTHYRASEFLIYIYGLCPGLLYGLLPEPYYSNFCKLVHGFRVLHQRSKTHEVIREAHRHFLEFVMHFEEDYYQRRLDRLHFVRTCIHSLVHQFPWIVQIGSLTEVAQWTMERTIGNIGEEIRQHSTPFANLSQRTVLRAQFNTLKAMVPDLDHDSDNKDLPDNALDIGQGYQLRRCRELHILEEDELVALNQFAQGLGKQVNNKEVAVDRYARLKLPNGQIARSSWKELEKEEETVRRARNVKLTIWAETRFAEIMFFFQASVSSDNGDVPLNLAMVSLYGPDDQALKQLSYGVLRVCEYHGNAGLMVIDAKSITEVVAMVPFDRRDQNAEDMTEFFVLDKASLGSWEHEIHNDDDEDD
ncbi:hypothetical protein C8J56DRAFT_801872 [Mycena floridula]|nr:hypothetical protein C8J56DRAFT_801840 [Mycena floridula]KAJ7575214.1 hypothetical protein C8J56DRAFT_801872 [Mycena floridula]